MSAPVAVPSRIALFVLHNHAPGIVRVLLNLAAGFLARGHAVDLIEDRPECYTDFPIPEGARRVPLSGDAKAPPGQRLARYLQEERPAAVLAAGHPANVAAVRARVAAGQDGAQAAPRARVVVSTHMTLSAFMRHNHIQLNRMVREIRQVYPQSDAIVTVSNGVAEDLVRLTGLPRAAVRTIYNPAVVPEAASGLSGEAHSPPPPAPPHEERGRGGEAQSAPPTPPPPPPAPPHERGEGNAKNEAQSPPSPSGEGGQGGEAAAPPSPPGEGGRGSEAGRGGEVPHPWLEPGQPPVLLGSGRLAPQKDFLTLLEAFARLRAAWPGPPGRAAPRLIILGEGPERERLGEVAGRLGVAGDVAFPGFVPDPFAYLRRAALFALSSIHEGFPNVMLEALACGTPIVSTDCPSGPRELLQDGRLGPLVPVRNAEALAAAMRSVLEHPTPAEALRRRAADFSLESICAQYLAALLGPGA